MIGTTLLRIAIPVRIVLPALAMAPDVVRSMKIRSMWGSSGASPPLGYKRMSLHHAQRKREFRDSYFPFGKLVKISTRYRAHQNMTGWSQRGLRREARFLGDLANYFV
jgi:hypothetical protein